MAKDCCDATAQLGSRPVAIQDLYAPEYRHCFGCGADNPHGWHIKSYLEGTRAIATYEPKAEYTGGVPHNMFGGFLAAILDCHGTASAAAFAHCAEGKTLGVEPLIRCVTASLTVNYRKPTPMGKPLQLVCTLEKVEGRKVWVNLSVGDGEEIFVDGTMLAIRVKA